MSSTSRTARFARVAVLLLLCSTIAAVAQNGPTVKSVEPPNWWVGLEPSHLMLLLTGSNLSRAQVSVSHSGVNIARVQTQANGNYAFVWLQIDANAAPASFPVKIRTAQGQTSVNFRLDARSSAAGKYAGLSPDDVIYLAMPDRFADGDITNDTLADRSGSFDRHEPKAYHGGDLKGVRDHLPYLKGLGVTAIWLTPFWANLDADYHGYHVVNFYGVDTHFGTIRDVEQLVADAHQAGIKIVLDYVVNHTGPRHPWAANPPTNTWLHGTPQQHIDATYKFDGIVDPHASYVESRQTLEGWFVNRLPDLNPDDPLLATYLLENATWWTEMTGLDAYRLDTFPYSSRTFWSQWHQGMFRTYPHTFSIGEVSDPDPTIVAFFQGGRRQNDGIDTGVTSVFDFPLMDAFRDVIIRGKPMQRLIDVLQRDWIYSHPELLVTFCGNHDNKRFLGEEGSSTAKLKAAYSLLLTMRGIPQLYYGDEIAMTGGDDPDNRHDFPGGFPGDSQNAFTAQGRTAEQQNTFDELQKLIALRSKHPALRDGKQTHISWDQTYYAFMRSDTKEQLLIVYNNSGTARTIDLDFSFTPLEQATTLVPLFQAQATQWNARHASVMVAPYSIAVYAVK
jgi:neopullulanase